MLIILCTYLCDCHSNININVKFSSQMASSTQHQASDPQHCSKKKCHKKLPNDWIFKLCPTCRGHDQASKKRRKERDAAETSQRPAPCPPCDPEPHFPAESDLNLNPATMVRYLFLGMLVQLTKVGYRSLQCIPTCNHFYLRSEIA